MLDRFRTLAGKFMVERLPRPQALVVSARFWLAAEASDFEEKRLCLEAVLELDPVNTKTGLAPVALGSEKDND